MYMYHSHDYECDQPSLNMGDDIIQQLLEGDDSDDESWRRQSPPPPHPLDETDDFIDQLRQEECLWNEHHKLFKDKHARKLSIERIAYWCGMDEKKVQKKRERLRYKYKNELIKLQRAEQNASPGNSTPVTSKWPYFEGMDFLREHIQLPKHKELSGSNSIRSEVRPEPSEDAVREDDLPIAAEIECEDDDSDQSDSPQVEDVADPSWSPSSKNKKKRAQQSTGTRQGAKKGKKKAAKKTQNTEDSHQVMASKKIKEQKEAEQSTDDPEETFGKHIAHELRNISDQRCKQYVKMEIQKLLFEAQFGNVSFHSGSDHQTSPDPGLSTN